MNILGLVEKVPGGLMVIPLLAGATVNTVIPNALHIGGFTQALFKDGALPIIGAFLFCLGSQIPIRSAGTIIEKGLAIVLGKLCAGIMIAMIAAYLMPSGTLWTLTPMAIIAAMTNANLGMYAALTQQFGNTSDRGAVSIISFNEGPFMTLVVLGAAGLASIPIMTFIGIVFPVILGLVLGNLDERIRTFLAPGQTLLIPFFAFALGAGIDFKTLLVSGFPGILLGLLTLFVSGGGAVLFLYCVHRIRRRPIEQRSVIAGLCEASVAGAAVATPAVVVAADPAYRAVEAAATAQIAGAVVTTAILTPVVVLFVSRWQAKRGVQATTDFEHHQSGQPNSQATISSK